MDKKNRPSKTQIIQSGWIFQGEGENKPGGESARHRGWISKGKEPEVKKPRGKMAKGEKAIIRLFRHLTSCVFMHSLKTSLHTTPSPCNYARKQLLLSAHLSRRSSVRLFVCSSVTRVDQSKTVQARITKSSPSAAWKTLVSGTVKLFHKFEGGHPERERGDPKWEGMGKICNFWRISRCISVTVWDRA